MAPNRARSCPAALPPSLCALLLLSHSLCALAAPAIFFVDSAKGPYLRPGASPSATGALSAQALVAVDTSLLGLPPTVPIDAELSARIGGLISPDVFNRPRAVLAVSLTGIDPQESHVGNLTASFSSRGGMASVGMASGDPGAVLGAVHLVATAARGNGGSIRLLGSASSPICGEACQEEYLEQALAAAGARYQPGADPFTGTVAFGSSTFRLGESHMLVWATEIAGLWGAAGEFVSELEGGEAGSRPTLLESTMMGLQLARVDQGAGSAQFYDLVSLTGAVLGKVHIRLEGALDGRLVLQIGLLGSAGKASAEGGGMSVEEMAQITMAHRRRLMQQSSEAGEGQGQKNSEGTVPQFSTKAAGIVTFLLLLFITLGAMYCMINMPVRQDTLLYSRLKVD